MARTRRDMRLGLLVPSSNTTAEADFWRLAPKGTSVHSARMMCPNNTIEGILRMERDAEDAAKMVSSADVDVIVYACTSGSFIGGIKHERELRARLEQATGRQVVTTSEAVIAALHALGVKKVAVATPYLDEINEKLVPFFAENGLLVTKLRGLGLEDDIETGDQEPGVAWKLAEQVDTAEAEGIFISCTNLRSAEAVDKIERDFGKPTTCSNVATLWYTLRKLGCSDEIGGAGMLLRDPALRPQ